MQDILVEAVRRRLSMPAAAPECRFSGRGIVTCAGGQRYFTCAWMLVRVLRHALGCTLPMQVWHLGRGEISEGMQLILEEEDIEIVDAEQVLGRFPARVSGGWPLKPYAIANSRFAEVIFLDADTIPFRDPTEIFSWQLYRDHGALFWPDVIDLRKQAVIWQRLGLAPQDRPSFESGILAVDKSRCWNLLDLAILLNEHWEEMYRLVHGDKDCFLMAAALSRVDVGIIAHRPFATESDLVQRDPDGEPFLHHRTFSKWNFTGPNRPVAAPHLQQTCDAELAVLRERWTGIVFHPPARTARSQAAEEDLIATRRFSYDTSVGPSRELELLAGGRVGKGRAEYEQHWAVVETPQGVVLRFYSATRMMVEMKPLADGSWAGTSLSIPPFDARLIRPDVARAWPHANAPRIDRQSLRTVDDMLNSGLLLAGFDPDLSAELTAALSWLNRNLDDVPECILQAVERRAIPAPWASVLRALAAKLARARDTRLETASVRAQHPVEIDPATYRRP